MLIEADKPTEVSLLLFAPNEIDSIDLKAFLTEISGREVRNCDALEEATAGPNAQVLVVLDLDTHANLLTEIFQWQMRLGLPWFKLICLSSNDDEEAMLLCYALGASDYILKPLRLKEVAGKIKRLLNDQSLVEPEMEHQLDIDDVLLSHLTMRELQILKALQAAPRAGINREELYLSVWREVSVHRKTLDVHIFNIRRKIRPIGYDICCSDQKFRISKIARVQSELA